MRFQRLASDDLAKTLPDRIAEHFIARIFTGELAAGERLPSDRELAPLLGVDRTSLRMAMQQLSRLGLVRAVRGSGVRVLDFREHAGLDFHAIVISLPQLSLGSSYLLQLLDDWIEVMPSVVGRALARATHADFRLLDGLISEQLDALAAGAPLDEVVALEVALQDQLTRTLGNTSLMLLANSSRPLRLKLVKMYFEATCPREHLEMQRLMLRACMGSGAVPVSAQAVADAFRSFLVTRTAGLRENLHKLPVSPALIVPAAAKARTRRAPRTVEPSPQRARR